jgi:hypothetical protein
MTPDSIIRIKLTGNYKSPVKMLNNDEIPESIRDLITIDVPDYHIYAPL